MPAAGGVCPVTGAAAMAVRWAADMAPPMAKTTGAKFTVSPGFSGPKGPERDHKATTKRHCIGGA